MSPAAASTVSDLRAEPGELSFTARVGDHAHRLWFRCGTAPTPPADAALATLSMPAMSNGGALRIDGPVWRLTAPLRRLRRR